MMDWVQYRNLFVIRNIWHISLFRLENHPIIKESSVCVFLFRLDNGFISQKKRLRIFIAPKTHEIFMTMVWAKAIFLVNSPIVLLNFLRFRFQCPRNIALNSIGNLTHCVCAPIKISSAHSSLILSIHFINSTTFSGNIAFPTSSFGAFLRNKTGRIL